MIFNGIDFTEYLVVEKIHESLLPPIENILTTIPRSNKAKFERSNLGPRLIEIEVRIIKSRKTLEENIRYIAGLLYTTEPKKLVVNDKYYIAILDGETSLETFIHTGSSTLSFIAPDGVAYGNKLKHQISGTTQINVSGNYKTLPKFTFNITENINKIEIRNNLGKYVLINHNFINGDIVEVDFDDKWKVRKNQMVIAKDVTILSDFFSLQRGLNTITVNVPCQLEYTERWL